jgi:hypothetical protein
MGLDAAVYRSKANLPFDADSVGAVVDESTGEYHHPDPNLEPAFEREFPRKTRVAVQKRIGNSALVAVLREDAKQVLEDHSITLSKVLYSGTHCGDSIPLDLTSALEAELVRLRRYAEQNHVDHLKQFVSDMQDLVEGAKRESNPIVF